ncbi:hypothetical protein, partial [Lacrimispora amygdalina]|uniref:hypothetical protein n=1 Tax=Lacrimispora amygdalina TaxID=253257 RepID=UPI0031F87559
VDKDYKLIVSKSNLINNCRSRFSLHQRLWLKKYHVCGFHSAPGRTLRYNHRGRIIDGSSLGTSFGWPNL